MNTAGYIAEGILYLFLKQQLLLYKNCVLRIKKKRVHLDNPDLTNQIAEHAISCTTNDLTV